MGYLLFTWASRALKLPISGPDVSDDKDILHFSQLNFIGGKYDWAYKSAPQKAYEGREIDIPCGRALGGGSVINGCKSAVRESCWLQDTGTVHILY